jgi:broad specificity phosphatase PhoE
MRIVSSPSRRARETAEAIATAAGIAAIELDARWCEADFGIAEGLTFEALDRLDPDLAHRLANGETRIDWPHGESADILATRVAAAWRDVLGNSGDTVVVTHAGPLRIALGLATGLPTDAIELPAPGAVIRIPKVVAT